uniref:Uncharacterized protein n=1 Tax=Arundo donax TaxID=35708 RepID=A0A0A9PVZ8_ARUDO
MAAAAGSGRHDQPYRSTRSIHELHVPATQVLRAATTCSLFLLSPR